MGKSYSVQIWTQYLPRPHGAYITLLLIDENRVPVHRHEVQRRGTRQAGAAWGRTREDPPPTPPRRGEIPAEPEGIAEDC